MARKLTIEEFIKKAKKIQNNKYDYSEMNYINSRIKVKIICKQCNTVFNQSPHDHLNGRGCPPCGLKKRSIARSSNTVEFIKKSGKIHGDKYDYSKINYKGSFIPIKILCPKHEEFSQTPAKHLSGHGCPKCSIDKNKKLLSSTTEEFIKKSRKIHKNKYDYSLVDYKNNHINVKIICKEHGEFEQTPLNHLLKKGCPQCNSSKGELKIENWLKKNNLKFTYQKTFSNCKNPKTNHKLLFDFYLPRKNILIEFDGIQHFKQIFNRESPHIVQYRDSIKTLYAKNNNIKLIRIPYFKIDDIEKILKENIFG